MAKQLEPVVSFLPVALIAAETSDEAERPAPVDKPAAKRSHVPCGSRSAVRTAAS